ncbi:MAG: hypothetical protein ACKVH0_10445, partial [Alphaproteobacteria bacterium]
RDDSECKNSGIGFDRSSASIKGLMLRIVQTTSPGSISVMPQLPARPPSDVAGDQDHCDTQAI